MKGFGAALAFGLALVLLVVFLVNWNDATNVNAREVRTELELAQAQALAPKILLVKTVALGALATLLLAVAAWGLNLAYTGITSLRATREAVAIRAHLVFPQKFGSMYPAAGQIDDTGRLLLERAPQDARAHMVAALTTGNVDRLNGSGVRAVLRQDDPQAMLPEPEPEVYLPPRVTVYEAPLSRQLHLPVGVDGNGPVQLPLRDLGSGVIGGLQGQGKSEAMAAMIAGLLRQDASGQHLRLIIMDLKGGADFGRIPSDMAALALPLVRDPEAAVAAANSMWAEVQRRQELFYKAGCSRIETYNERAGVDGLPYLFSFIDEALIITSPANERGMDRATRTLSAAFLSATMRVVAEGRAFGVGCFLATQKPSSDVIPTGIRDLCGMRLAFRCSTSEASRAILDRAGAELLPADPGRGLLVHGQPEPRLIRAYMADLEHERFSRFVKGLPRGDGAAYLTPPAEGAGAVINGVVSYKADVPVYRPDVVGEGAFGTKSAGIPVRRIEQDAPPQEDDRRYIYERWKVLGSFKAVERELYGQDGGIKFYWVREAVNEMRRRRGLPPV